MRKFTAAALLAMTSTAACSGLRAQDSGPTISRNYQVGGFNKIEVGGSYNVEVRTGSNVGVSARGGEKLLEHTIVEVQGDTLVIKPERSNGFWNSGVNGHATFTITVPQLAGASIAGSGDMKVDRVQGNGFDGAVTGSGSLEVAAVQVQQLKLAISGSGEAKAAGQAQAVDYQIAGSGGIDAGGVQSQNAKVSIAGSGDVKAHATGAADVSIMGSGDVDISGGAKCSVSKAGSGSVRCS